MYLEFSSCVKYISNLKTVTTQDEVDLLDVSIASSKESKRTFLTPDRSLDIFLTLGGVLTSSVILNFLVVSSTYQI